MEKRAVDEERKGDKTLNDDKVLKLFKSRKAFVLEYLCALFLVFLSVYSRLKDYQFNKWLNWVVLGLAILIVILIEFNRASN